MPHASHRVDLLLVPLEIERDAPRLAFAALLTRWRAQGRLVGNAPGPVPLVPGGFDCLRLDDPGRVSLYANQQGGFQVRCPATAANAAAAFGRGVEAWRAGGPREADCPRCQRPHALEDYELRPPGGFARFAVIFADAVTLDLDAEARAELERALGPLRDIARRVSG